MFLRSESGWYVVYEFAYEYGALSQPKPITALKARWDGHLGGGLAVLDDGALLFAVGENGDSYEVVATIRRRLTITSPRSFALTAGTRRFGSWLAVSATRRRASGPGPNLSV